MIIKWRRSASLKRVQVSGLIVRGAGLPAAIDDANPFVGQGAQRGLVGTPLVTLALEPDNAASDYRGKKMSKNVEMLLIHGGSQPTKALAASPSTKGRVT